MDVALGQTCACLNLKQLFFWASNHGICFIFYSINFKKSFVYLKNKEIYPVDIDFFIFCQCFFYS